MDNCKLIANNQELIQPINSDICSHFKHFRSTDQRSTVFGKFINNVQRTAK